MAKTRVALICGGASAEHEISLLSASNVLAAIDPTRFDVVVIGIDKRGVWHRYPRLDFVDHPGDPARIALQAGGETLAVRPGPAAGALRDADTGHALADVDVVFPVTHGTLGEDGALQGLLRHLNLAFVGCDIGAAAAAMDKALTKRLLRDAGLPVAPFCAFTRGQRAHPDYAALAAELGETLFVKPARQGSSIGVSRATSPQTFAVALADAFAHDDKVVVEAAIAGREIECAVLGNDAPEASPCGEIVLGDGFYSYETKYLDPDAAGIEAPADLPAATSEAIRELAVAAFTALDGAGLARVDFFLTGAGEILINEINTLPGFTAISMYPKLWQAAGLGYTELISRLIDLALTQRAGRPEKVRL